METTTLEVKIFRNEKGEPTCDGCIFYRETPFSLPYNACHACEFYEDVGEDLTPHENCPLWKPIREKEEWESRIKNSAIYTILSQQEVIDSYWEYGDLWNEVTRIFNSDLVDDIIDHILHSDTITYEMEDMKALVFIYTRLLYSPEQIHKKLGEILTIEEVKQFMSEFLRREEELGEWVDGWTEIPKE